MSSHAPSNPPTLCPVAGPHLLHQLAKRTDWLDGAYGRCPIAGWMSIVKLTSEHGTAMLMGTSLQELAKAYSQFQAGRTHDPCGAKVPKLVRWFALRIAVLWCLAEIDAANLAKVSARALPWLAAEASELDYDKADHIITGRLRDANRAFDLRYWRPVV